MPSWAAEQPREYWDAADLYERANGRLYVSADFALPRDLSREDQIVLAHEFAQELTKDGSLPYTLAIHAGHDSTGVENNPHAHMMTSERKNDGIDRTPEQWFSRFNRADPSKGGAEKTRAIHGRAWMEHARERWADLTNKTLDPGRHFGPAAAHMLSRGHSHDRLELAATIVTSFEQLQSVDQAIAALESERQMLTADDQKGPGLDVGSQHGAASTGDTTRDQDESRSR